DDAEAANLSRAIRVAVTMFSARNHQHFVRAHFGITAGPDGHENDDYDNDAERGHRHCAKAAEETLCEEEGVVHRFRSSDLSSWELPILSRCDVKLRTDDANDLHGLASGDCRTAFGAGRRRVSCAPLHVSNLADAIGRDRSNDRSSGP